MNALVDTNYTWNFLTLINFLRKTRKIHQNKRNQDYVRKIKTSSRTLGTKMYSFFGDPNG